MSGEHYWGHAPDAVLPSMADATEAHLDDNQEGPEMGRVEGKEPFSEGKMLELKHVTIVSVGLPPAAEYAAERLAGFFKQAGAEVARTASARENGISVLVGREAARRAGVEVDGAGLGPEGVLLAAGEDGRLVVAAGGSAAGDMNAIYRLMREVDVTGPFPRVRRDLSVREKLAHNLRGMYAHQHWDYSYPYALRTWSVEEWQKYTDMLALLGCNLFQIWSMAGLLPVPLSDADRRFLERYPPVMEHARKRLNMTVWIGECANNVSEAEEAPPIEQRDYFEYEVLKDPSDPKQMADLRKAREVFYSICDSADGYFVIDSDPGGWPGSPSSEFVDILEMNRELISSLTARGKEALLVYWMWFSWGNGSRPENWRETLKLLKERDPAPWMMTAAFDQHYEVVDDLGLRDRALYYPYSAVEPEPSLPFTRVVPPELERSLEFGGSLEGLPGVMGNAQTPLCQLPDIFHFLEWAWSGRQASREETVKELARLIYPRHAELLEKGWLCLAAPDEHEATRLGGELRDLAEAAQASERMVLGPLAMGLFPDKGQIARDLAAQLELAASAARFVRLAQAEDEGAKDELIRYAQLALRWRRQTGFRMFGYNGYSFDAVDAAARKLWWKAGGLDAEVQSGLRETLSAEFEPWEVELAMLPLTQPR